MAILPFWGCSIGTYGFTATVPVVVKELGYTSAHAQLMTIPIYVVAMVSTVIVAFCRSYPTENPIYHWWLLHWCHWVYRRAGHSSSKVSRRYVLLPVLGGNRALLPIHLHRHAHCQQSCTVIQACSRHGTPHQRRQYGRDLW